MQPDSIRPAARKAWPIMANVSVGAPAAIGVGQPAMAIFVFRVPLKGSFLVLLIGTVIFVFTTTGYGMFISTFCRTQIAALFGTAILTLLPASEFSGMRTPVSSLSGTAQIIGYCFPMSYYRPISVGTFTKGLGFQDLGSSILTLTLFVPVLTLASLLLLRKQER